MMQILHPQRKTQHLASLHAASAGEIWLATGINWPRINPKPHLHATYMHERCSVTDTSILPLHCASYENSNFKPKQTSSNQTLLAFSLLLLLLIHL
jgi:hypothetical protein